MARRSRPGLEGQILYHSVYTRCLGLASKTAAPGGGGGTGGTRRPVWLFSECAAVLKIERILEIVRRLHKIQMYLMPFDN